MKITILILLSICLQHIAFSGELLDIRKIDENAILIRFTNNVNYSSSLSDDKKNISLKIDNTQNSLNRNKQRIDSKLIEEVFIQKRGENLLLNILLKKGSGFNSYKLPYSNSIIISAFDWNKLTKDEDKFRSGLFAYESSLYKQAIILFDEAKGTVQKAHSMLGLIYLLQDSLEISFSELNIAARNNTNIPDVYAALSQIYSEKGSKTKAQYYEQKFKNFLGVKDSLFEYPKLIFTKDKIDSLQVGNFTDSSNANLEEVNTNKRFSNLFDKSNSGKTTLSQNKDKLENENSFLVFKGFLKYILIFSTLVILALIALYLKWRKLKIDAQNSLAKASFEQELLKENTKAKQKEGIVIDRTDNDFSEKKEKEIKSIVNRTETSKLNNQSNLSLEDINKKIEAKEILSNIAESNTPKSNLNTSFQEMDNNKLKLKLYKKYNVDNSKGKQ